MKRTTLILIVVALAAIVAIPLAASAASNSPGSTGPANTGEVHGGPMGGQSGPEGPTGDQPGPNGPMGSQFGPEGPMGGQFGPGGHMEDQFGPGGHMTYNQATRHPRMMRRVRAGLGIVAETAGVEPRELVDALRSGTTITEFLDEHGVSIDTVATALEDAANGRIETALENGRITAEQADQLQTRVAERVEQVLEGQSPQHAPWHVRWETCTYGRAQISH